jgi:hypothetical protein
MLRALAVGGLALASSLLPAADAQDCQTTGCPGGGRCCMCSCLADDYVAADFSCNCDNTKKHAPLPNDKQPHCCGGEFGFDAWCVKKEAPNPNKLQCSDQTTAGVPQPAQYFYPFGHNYRCVLPPFTCNSAFCDNPSVPDLEDQICHTPYVVVLVMRVAAKQKALDDWGCCCVVIPTPSRRRAVSFFFRVPLCCPPPRVPPL